MYATEILHGGGEGSSGSSRRPLRFIGGSVKFTRKGYIEVLRDGVFISRHTAAEEAYESAYAHAEENGGGVYVIRYPTRELDLSSIERIVQQDTVPPSAPVLTATASTSSVSLSWTASTDDNGIASYTLEYSTDQSTWATLYSGLTRTYLHEGLGEDVHYYRVSAFDPTGNQSNFGTASATIDLTAPTAPTLSLNVTGSSSISVSWSASTDANGVAGYTLQRSTDNATWTPLQDSTSRSYSDTGLSASTLYYYRVRAYDAAGNQSAWAASQATTNASSSFTALLTENFESGTVGVAYPRWNARSTYDTTRAYSGSKSLKIQMLDGATGYGGRPSNSLPVTITEGYSVWYRARFYFPSTFSFGYGTLGDGNGWSKFMVLAAGRIYVQIPARSQSSLPPTITGTRFLSDLINGAALNKIVSTPVLPLDEWVALQMQVYLSTTSSGFCRWWMNSTMVGEILGQSTMEAGSPLTEWGVGDYWNGRWYQGSGTDSFWMDDVVIATDMPGYGAPTGVDSNGNPYISPST